MPNNFFSVDSRFPNIANKTQEQINGEVINYLFLLLEQLRYTMGNLGVGNFNEAELDGIAGMISDPIYVRLEDAEGNVNAVQITAEGLTQRVSDLSGNVETLTITAEGLANRVSDAEGNISTLTQTADGLSTRVSDLSGNVETLTITAEGLANRVSDAEGNISTLTQTAEGLTQRVSDLSGNVETLTITAEGLANRVSDAEGNISTLTQTADGLSTRVSDAEGNVNALTQSSQAFNLRLTNAEGSVASLNLKADDLSATVGQHSLAINNLGIQMQGKVSFTNLQTAGETIIDAGNITTGTMRAITMEGCIIKNSDTYGNVLMMAGGNLTWYREFDQLIIGRVFFDSYQNLTITTLGDIQIRSSKGYSFLNTGNINTYISANAATIRALLGL